MSPSTAPLVPCPAQIPAGRSPSEGRTGNVLARPEHLANGSPSGTRISSNMQSPWPPGTNGVPTCLHFGARPASAAWSSEQLATQPWRLCAFVKDPLRLHPVRRIMFGLLMAEARGMANPLWFIHEYGFLGCVQPHLQIPLGPCEFKSPTRIASFNCNHGL